MSLSNALLQAACDYSNKQEQQLQSFAVNWTAQVAELTEQLHTVTKERDEARANLNHTRICLNQSRDAFERTRAALCEANIALEKKKRK